MIYLCTSNTAIHSCTKNTYEEQIPFSHKGASEVIEIKQNTIRNKKTSTAQQQGGTLLPM